MSVQREMEAFAARWRALRRAGQQMLEKPYKEWSDIELRTGAELFDDPAARRAHQRRRHIALRSEDKTGFFAALDEMERKNNRKFSCEEIDCEIDRLKHVIRRKKAKRRENDT